MIVTRKLTKLYKGAKGSSTLAVDNIDFEVFPKDIFGFLGPNGAGKTTTIHVLTTVLEPTGGTAEICGFDVVKSPLQAKRSMGFMPELPAFYDEMKAEDQLRFYCKFYGYSVSESRQRSKELMELVGLSAHRQRRIKTFSHGMRKRLALAQSMVNDPDLLILDEPLGGLDPMGVYAFREMIKELNKNGITIFLSSHLLSEVQQICNKVCIIHHGKILAVDTIKNLSKKFDLKSSKQLSINGPGLSKDILDYISTIPGVSTLTADTEGEGGFIIMVDNDNDTEAVAEELNRALAKKDIYLSRLERAKPSLEEVFMKITRGD